MQIVALETATDACSVAVYRDGEILERFEVTPRQHTQWILPMLKTLLLDAGLTFKDLDALAFGRGPGAFTCVRIAAGAVQGLALGTGLPVVPVSTLAALAWEVFAQSDAEYALAALDARMGEVYWGMYRRGLEEGREVLVAPEEIVMPEAGACIGIGPGWQVYGEVLRSRLKEGQLIEVWSERLPRAFWVAQLAAKKLATRGEVVAPGEALPVYLRDRVVEGV